MFEYIHIVFDNSIVRIVDPLLRVYDLLVAGKCERASSAADTSSSSLCSVSSVRSLMRVEFARNGLSRPVFVSFRVAECPGVRSPVNNFAVVVVLSVRSSIGKWFGTLSDLRRSFVRRKSYRSLTTSRHVRFRSRELRGFIFRDIVESYATLGYIR